MVFHPCNAFSNEVQHLYLATGLTRGEDQPDEDEFLNLKKFPLEEAYQMIADGRITDAKTIITLQWYQLHASK